MGYFEDEADEEYWLEQAEELGEDLDVDTREGSVYMDAAAGHCMRTAKFYSDLSMVFEMLAVDTCGGDILSEKTAMDGIIRTPATSACWSAEFDGAVPESGSEFMVGDIYLVWQSVGDEFYLVADEAGVQANQLIPGEDLIPVDNVDDLISATLGELVIPGTDEERGGERLNKVRLKTETDSIIKHGAKALEELDEREYCHYGRERTRLKPCFFQLTE